MKKLLTFIFCFWCIHLNAQELRIVSVGSNLTEILYALDLGEHVVAADKTSTTPPIASNKAVLGHPSNISMEGALSYLPTHYISDDKYPNPALHRKLTDTNIKAIILPQATTIDDLIEQISLLGKAFNRQEQSQSVISSLNMKQHQLSQLNSDEKIKAAFIYGKDSLAMMGKNTTVDHLLTLASIENSFTFEGIKPVNPESLLVANPDVLLTVDKALINENGKARFFTIPGIRGTNAGKNKIIHTIPIKQVNITLKTLDTALELHHLLYGTNE